MSISSAWPQVLDYFGTPLVIEPSLGQLSGDAGLLAIRQFDQRVGLTRTFADALDDPRDPDLTEYTFLEMVRSCVYGILAGCEDQDDHGTLGTGPASSWARLAHRTLANWQGSSGFLSTTLPMKREWPRRRGPCALRSAPPPQEPHFRQSAPG